MRYILRCLLCGLLLSVASACVAIAAQPVMYTEDKPLITVTAAQPQFTIKLKSNPTTGYAWSLQEYDSNLITSVKHFYKAGNPTLVGAPGFEFWLFKMKPAAFTKPQQTTLRFVYARPWEKNNAVSEKVFKVVTH